MAKAAKQAKMEHELDAFHSDLLRERPRTLRSDQGDEAFQQHKLLAAAVHCATELDRRKGESSTDAWVRYISRHFPSGRNDGDDARLLFGDWRSALLKRGTPGARIAITHGQPEIHWRRDQHGRLCLNLEDTWDDFAASVGSFIEHLRRSPRRKVVLTRWRKQRWLVEPFVPAKGATVMTLSLSGAPALTASASVASSASATHITPSAQSITASPPPTRPLPKPEP